LKKSIIIDIKVVIILSGIPELKLFSFCFPLIHTFFYLSVQPFAFNFYVLSSIKGIEIKPNNFVQIFLGYPNL